ncbi:flagellar protein FlaG [Pseudomonas sp. K1(2024)]|uniref:Flagellar protein FlaG n=1 Tax=Pseudomonas boreofloridensis TaxID=3064348 RepID=A0ABV4ZA63_9PSED|nr:MULTISPECIES: flagellar protein FlaG [unclassified Pseudomonas]MDO7901187.1 flagellar protein FlaG [Pseudomonas sp. K13]MDV9034070.1 flagellar protein FlaG [Pseudomonas sp. RAC1]
MDMSVKLNLSYPAPRAAEQVPEKQAPLPSQQRDDRDDKKDAQVPHGADNVKHAVSQIEEFMKQTRRNLQFSTDEESGKIVVKVIASETGELIRQIPSEEALRIAHSLSDVKSVLFDAKA